MWAAVMLGKQHDLVYVAGIMQKLPRDGLHDAVLLAGDQHLPVEVLRFKWDQCRKHAIPSFVPPAHDVGTGCAGFDFKLAVSMPIRLLAIAGEKVCPPRTHIAGHVLDDDCD